MKPAYKQVSGTGNLSAGSPALLLFIRFSSLIHFIKGRMKTINITKILFTLFCSGITFFGYSQITDSSNAARLDSVTIFADKISRTIIPVQTLSGTQLQNLSVYSVADAIRFFSGVQIKDYGGIGGLKTVNIRSLGSQHTGVFYDGIQLGNAQNGVVDLGRFSMDNITAITLYNGQKSSIFQPAKDFASAGSIYLTSRVPAFSDSQRYHFKATLKAGSFSTINPSILWEQRISENISAAFNTEYLYTTGRYRFNYKKKDGYDTTETRRNGDVESLRMEAGIFGKIKDGEWKAKAYWYRSERGYPGAAVREEPGKFRNQDRQWDNNFFLQSSFRKNFHQRYSILLNAKYANDYLHYLSDPRLDASTMYIDNRYHQQELYFSAANLFNILPQWSINLSGDLQWNTLDADLVNFVYPTRITALSAIATTLDLSRFKVQGSLLGTFVNEKTKMENAAAKNRQEYTPTIVLSYQPFSTPDIYLRAFYKRIFRMPTLNDLYYTFIGNKNLDPEYTNQYNAGITYTRSLQSRFFKSIELQTDLYFNQIENKIIAMPTSNQFRWTMINLGYTEIRGIDVVAQTTMQITQQWLANARLSYTYQKAQDFTHPGSTYYGGQIPYIPWHSGSVILNAEHARWSIQYSYIYTGERYESVANIPENYAQPWYTHDLSFARKLYYHNKPIRISAEINNLLNQQYEVVQWYPMPGINFRTTITITL